MKFHVSTPPHLHTPTGQIQIFPQLFAIHKRLLFPLSYGAAQSVSQVEKSEFTKHIRGLSRQDVLLMVTLVAHVAL